MNVTCTGCPAKYSVPDEKVRGKKVRITCKHCGTNIIVDGTALEVTARAPAEPAGEAPSAMASLAASPPATDAPKPAASAASKPNEAVKPAAFESSFLVGFIDERQEQHTTSSVVELYASGKIDDETLVWKDGMADWLSPFDVPEIAVAMKAKGVSRRAPSFAFGSESSDEDATVIARSPFEKELEISRAAREPAPAQAAPEKAPDAAIRQSTPEIKPGASPLPATRTSAPELGSEPQAAKPVAARRAEQIVERRVGEVARDRARRGVALAHENRAVLIAVLERAEPEDVVLLNGAAGGKGVLLAVERRRRVRAVKGRRQALQAAVAEEERAGAVQLVRAALGDNVDDRRA